MKPLEEMFDTAEGINELVLTRGGIFCRLGALVSNKLHKSIEEHRPKEER